VQGRRSRGHRAFRSLVDLYLNMLNMQLTYDALKIIGFDANLMQELGARCLHAGLATPGRSPRGSSWPHKAS